jgi:hypothetical protein
MPSANEITTDGQGQRRVAAAFRAGCTLGWLSKPEPVRARTLRHDRRRWLIAGIGGQALLAMDLMGSRPCPNHHDPLGLAVRFNLMRKREPRWFD